VTAPSELITPEIAAHALWHYGYSAIEPGSFTRSLLETIARASPNNRACLAAAFPGQCAAMTLAELNKNGIATLQDIAASNAHKRARPTFIPGMIRDVQEMANRLGRSPISGEDRAQLLTFLTHVATYLNAICHEHE